MYSALPAALVVTIIGGWVIKQKLEGAVPEMRKLSFAAATVRDITISLVPCVASFFNRCYWQHTSTVPNAG